MTTVLRYELISNILRRFEFKKGVLEPSQESISTADMQNTLLDDG